MNIDDELLMRYADGELDAGESAQLAARAAADPSLAARVAALQAQRARLRTAYAPELAEPVPERLRAMLAGGGADVVDLAARREARAAAPPRRWSWREWSAMAASVAVGMLVVQLWPGGRGGAQLGVGGAGLASGSALAQALSTQLAADQPADAPVRVGVSFRSRGGELCRTFVARAAQPVSGLACFANGRWRVDVAAAGEAGAGGAPGALRTAASDVDPAVLEVLAGRIDGEPLDAAAERAARARGWVEAPRR